MNQCKRFAVTGLFTLGLLALPHLRAGGGASGPPAGWTAYTSKDKTFTVWLPAGGKKEQVRVIRPQGILLRFNTVTVAGKDGLDYTAGTILFQRQQDILRVPLPKRVELIRDLFVEGSRGKVVQTDAIAQGRVKGKEYLIEGKGVTLKVRAYAFAGFLYAAAVAGTKDQVASKDADRFLDSYRLPERVTNLTEPAGGPGRPGKEKGPATAGDGLRLPSVGGMVMAPDRKTLVVTVPSAGQLVYIDTLAGKELKKVEVEFQPGAIALQGRKLFVATKGTATVHVLDLDSGKPLREIKIAGEPVETLACHPAEGLVYAANGSLQVFSLDPATGKVAKTRGAGQYVLVDPSDSRVVYTSTFKPAKHKLLVQELPDRSLKMELIRGKAATIVFKYAAQGPGLKFVVGTMNAGSGSPAPSVSRDGKSLVVAGPYRGPGIKGLNFGVAVWDTADLKTIRGQLQMKFFARAACFHPQLDLVAVLADAGGDGLRVFNAKSLVEKQFFALPPGTNPPYLLAFGAGGTKLVCALPVRGPGGRDTSVVLEFYSLSLTDQQREALQKSSAP